VKVVRDEELIEAILTTPTLKAAAAQVGCCERTAHRRADKPEFQRKLERANSQKLGAAINALRSNSFDVVTRLFQIATGTGVPVYVSASACARYIELMLRAVETQDFESRLTELEKIIATEDK
jgi:hypothetical protein